MLLDVCEFLFKPDFIEILYFGHLRRLKFSLRFEGKHVKVWIIELFLLFFLLFKFLFDWRLLWWQYIRSVNYFQIIAGLRTLDQGLSLILMSGAKLPFLMSFLDFVIIGFEVVVRNGFFLFGLNFGFRFFRRSAPLS